jgi:type IV pilus assembly protein PilA
MEHDNMKKFFRYGSKGFTLIELLVVIAILGTLAAVVILNVTKYIGSGRTEGRATELANFQTAVAAYMYDHTGAVPTGGPFAGTGGVLSPFFLNSLNCSYTVDAAGKATQGACTK